MNSEGYDNLPVMIPYLGAGVNVTVACGGTGVGPMVEIAVGEEITVGALVLTVMVVTLKSQARIAKSSGNTINNFFMFSPWSVQRNRLRFGSQLRAGNALVTRSRT